MAIDIFEKVINEYPNFTKSESADEVVQVAVKIRFNSSDGCQP